MNELQLKKFGPGDFALYFRLVGNSAVMSHITGRALTVEEASEAYRDVLRNNALHPAFGRFKMRDAHSGEFIGLARLSVEEADATEAEVGLMLLPEHWHCGHGRMLTAELLERARAVPQLTELFAVIDPVNTASKKLLLASGFESERSFTMDGLPAEVLRLSLKQIMTNSQ